MAADDRPDLYFLIAQEAVGNHFWGVKSVILHAKPTFTHHTGIPKRVGALQRRFKKMKR